MDFKKCAKTCEKGCAPYRRSTITVHCTVDIWCFSITDIGVHLLLIVLSARWLTPINNKQIAIPSPWKKYSFAPVQNWPLIFSEVCMKATYPTCLNLLLCPIQMWSYLIASDLFVMSSDISPVLLQGHHTIILLFLYFWYNHPLLDHQKKNKSRSVSCICSMINEHFRQQYRQAQHTSCRKSLGRMA